MNLYTLANRIMNCIECVVVYIVKLVFEHSTAFLSKLSIMGFSYYVDNQVFFNTQLEDIYTKYPQFKECVNRLHYFSRCGSAMLCHTRIEPYATTWISTSALLVKDTEKIEYVEHYMGSHMSNLIDDIFTQGTRSSGGSGGSGSSGTTCKKEAENEFMGTVFNTHFDMLRLFSEYSNEIVEIMVTMRQEDQYVHKSLFYNKALLQKRCERAMPKVGVLSDNGHARFKCEGVKEEHKETEGGFFYINRLMSRSNPTLAPTHELKCSMNPVRLPLIPSSVSFLSVQYKLASSHFSIQLTVNEEAYNVGNHLFTPLFVKRCLEYQPHEYVFDLDYKLVIVDNNIKVLELDSSQYVVLEKDGYMICNV